MTSAPLGPLLASSFAAAGIQHLVSVANGEGFGLYQAWQQRTDGALIAACREGEAVAISCGLVLGGRDVVLSIENFGLFECLDTLRALPLDMNIPLVLVIGYTGRGGLNQAGSAALEQRLGNIASQAALAGRWTEPCLDFAGIPWWMLEADANPRHIASDIGAALTMRDRTGRPVALLVEMT